MLDRNPFITPWVELCETIPGPPWSNAKTVTLIVGIVLFNVQWRRYGVLWGGYLEWNCTLVSCHLRYSYTGTYRATGLRNFMVRSAKKFGNKRFATFAGEQWEAVESWIQDWEVP